MRQLIRSSEFSLVLHRSSTARLPGNVHVRIRKRAIRVNQRVVRGAVGWQLRAIDQNTVRRDDDAIGTASDSSYARDDVGSTRWVVGLTKIGILKDNLAGTLDVFESEFALTFERVRRLRARDASRVVYPDLNVSAQPVVQDNSRNPR